MLKFCVVGVFMTLAPSVFAQDTDPAPSGNEVEVLTINPETGAAVGTPGSALTDQMPQGPQTELVFPETPENVSPDDTTVIFEPSDPGSDSSDSGE